MTTRDQTQPTTPNHARRSAVFVGAVLRLSRDRRWLLHFLPGGRIVRRSVANYRRLLATAGDEPAKAPPLAARLLVYLPLVMKLAALALAFAQPFLGSGPLAEASAAARQILRWLQETLVTHGSGG